jgi:glutamate racemase
MEVKKILASEGQLNKNKSGRHMFYVSDNPEWFSGLAKRFLGRPLKNVKKVNNV